MTSMERREAFEEVGLPLQDHPDIHFITTLEPVATVLPHNAQVAHIIVIRTSAYPLKTIQLSSLQLS
jgi:8-oxo-dGTP pyrophosphatase MutT (NUDIX family)